VRLRATARTAEVGSLRADYRANHAGASSVGENWPMHEVTSVFLSRSQPIYVEHRYWAVDTKSAKSWIPAPFRIFALPAFIQSTIAIVETK
jgi:hypothetical protein